ncbi:MAG: hypothetical protein BECKG1743D_GA0114223_101855 [Candidatus Kentron sp. G]|nr:MAG: hypothetical protein BECKG1743F_GA0114225_102375 [Candidatus Kentron sp. G]VFM98592.1 MAG: hypothetical protein BECKG1743E_GA0114224_101983 [Candidatus Kentron sp. G]VFN00342.1 MAG: hypothetical protein BECKG1743D_GA0114223_101855 [Candidatus Kentron sp. G]
MTSLQGYYNHHDPAKGYVQGNRMIIFEGERL